MIKRSKTVLVTSAGVGTAINVIAALNKSERYNVRIVAVDADCHAVGLYLADSYHIVPLASDSSYIQCLIEICKIENVNFIIPLYSSEIRLISTNASEFVEVGVGVCLPSPKVVNLCDDKNEFLEFLAANQFDYPRTYKHSSEVQRYPIFIKPVVGSSSRGSRKVNNCQELDFYLGNSANQLMVQEYIDWDEYTADCMVSPSGVLLGCVVRRRIKVKGGAAVVARTVNLPIVEAEVARLLEKLGYVGACNVQLFYDGKKGIKFIEVNPRLSAGGLPLTVEAGVNIPEMMLRLHDGESITSKVAARSGITMYRYLTEIFRYADTAVR